MKRICPVCATVNQVSENGEADKISGSVCERCGSKLNLEQGPKETATSDFSDQNRKTSQRVFSKKPDKLPSVLSMRTRDQGARDYLALSIFFAALVVLIIAGF